MKDFYNFASNNPWLTFFLFLVSFSALSEIVVGTMRIVVGAYTYDCEGLKE